jgi:hypothetical protein
MRDQSRDETETSEICQGDNGDTKGVSCGTGCYVILKEEVTRGYSRMDKGKSVGTKMMLNIAFYSPLNVFDDGAVLLRSNFWTLSIVSIFFNHNVLRDGSSLVIR